MKASLGCTSAYLDRRHANCHLEDHDPLRHACSDSVKRHSIYLDVAVSSSSTPADRACTTVSASTMRLLNTTSLLLEEFIGDNIPYYAILSHRWENEEVTFQDLREGRGPDMAGYSKITGCCRQARLDGWEYAWVDSCCIDKSSSAELSEAINSMFKWYKDSQVCYSYLSDVKERSDFADSQWFTRGWTLQELLAPEFLIFYDNNWKEIDTKPRLLRKIESITGISVEHLVNFEDASIAQIMSWASRRRTTRIEDQAYCLMGLFGINMPPLYGEGSSSFLRLQLEILRTSEDETIFAWTSEDSRPTGLLARSAADFRKSSKIIRGRFIQDRAPYTMTNKGLRLEARLLPTDEKIDNFSNLTSGSIHVHLLPINCMEAGRSRLVALRVRRDFFGDLFRMLDLKLLPADYISQVGKSLHLGELEICYFRQASYEDDRYLAQNITVNVISQTGYRMIGTLTPNRNGDPSWYELEEPASTLQLNFDQNFEKALIFTDSTTSYQPANFAVSLSEFTGTLSVRICCKERRSPNGVVTWKDHQYSYRDKASYPVECGASISYKVRRDGLSVNKDRTRVKNYVVDIIVDPSGFLPWQPSPDEVETPSFYPSSGISRKLERRLRDIVEGKISLESLRVGNLSHASRSNMDFGSPVQDL